MEALYELKEIYMEELERIAENGGMGAGDLDSVHKLTDTIKNIEKICMLAEGSEYSHDGEWEADMRGSYDSRNSYARSRRGTTYVGGYYRRNSRDSVEDYSMRRGRQNRDSRGRYSREGGGNMGGGTGGNYSMRGGRYSRDDAAEYMVEKLHEMMNEASSEKERKAIKKCIEQIEEE